MTMSPTSLRAARSSDHRQIARLAALDSKAVPRGHLLLAEVEGDIPAALELETGTVFANPFRPTANLVALLELHARAA
jgi:hypothetical protein